jgi:hypothetical protein
LKYNQTIHFSPVKFNKKLYGAGREEKLIFVKRYLQEICPEEFDPTLYPV